MPNYWIIIHADGFGPWGAGIMPSVKWDNSLKHKGPHSAYVFSKNL